MRHKKGFNKLGRNSAHREAMLSNMASSLILHKRITTTLQKAKALRSFVEPIITLSKEDTMHNRRMAFKYLQNKESVKELFREVSNKVADRPVVIPEYLKPVCVQEIMPTCALWNLLITMRQCLVQKKLRKLPTSRTRRSRTKKTEEAPAAEVKSEKIEETPAAEIKTEETEKTEENPPQDQDAENDGTKK